jgi:hypothetical protein
MVKRHQPDRVADGHMSVDGPEQFAFLSQQIGNTKLPLEIR